LNVGYQVQMMMVYFVKLIQLAYLVNAMQTAVYVPVHHKMSAMTECLGSVFAVFHKVFVDHLCVMDITNVGHGAAVHGHMQIQYVATQIHNAHLDMIVWMMLAASHV